MSLIAEYFGISDQALSNKFYRDSYSGEDIINVAEFLECELAFFTREIKKNLAVDN